MAGNRFFWWPYHVFLQPDGTLQIAISTDCCDAHKNHNKSTPSKEQDAFLSAIRNDAAAIGSKTLKAFRNVFPGTCNRIPIETLKS